MRPRENRTLALDDTVRIESATGIPNIDGFALELKAGTARDGPETRDPAQRADKFFR